MDAGAGLATLNRTPIAATKEEKVIHAEDARRWRLLKALLGDALDQPPEKRQPFIEAATPDDDDLRAELIALAAAASCKDSPLDSPPAELAIDALRSHATTPWIGRQLGPYCLRKLIAGGGMGQVYLAERVDGQYKQRVAIKLMRDGFERAALVSRFKAERQILASLDHVNLAKVLDGGLTEEGVPYFVMELVAGETIDAYAARMNLSIAQRVQLFRSVCQVVHYVHQRGVVHRDLKAGNILVTHDGVVKLVDFGIAKHVVPGAFEQTRTATALRMMTLDYCSPEQVRGDEITPASDIYSLGVVLYRLLTRANPYRVATATAPADSAYDLARAICDLEPPPPSKAVAADSPADRRRLRGDLDAVVMMAMRKDPAHRYVSAEALSEDLFRHLEGLPVLARRGAWSYRAGRFVLRHRAVVGAAMVANLALVTGIALASYQAWQAHQQRERAERHFASVRQLAHVFIFDVHDAIQNLAGSTAARKMVVDNALVYLEGLSAEASGDAALRLEVATGYRKVGDILGGRNAPSLGDSHGAMASYDRAKALLTSAVSDPNERDAHFRKAQQELTLVYLRQGLILGGLGQAKEASEALHAGLAIAEDLAAADPANHDNQLLRVDMYRAQSDMELEAGNLDAYVRTSSATFRLLDAALARAPDDREIVGRLSSAYTTRGDYFLSRDTSDESARQGIVAYHKALTLYQRMYASHPDDDRFARNIATVKTNLGYALLRIGDSRQAAKELRSANQVISQSIERDPSNMAARSNLATVNLNLGIALLDQDDVQGSIDAAQAALDGFDRLPEGVRLRIGERLGYGEALYYLGKGLERRAAGRGPGTAQVRADLHAACVRFHQSVDILQNLKDSGKLTPGDIQPDTARKAMQRCPPAS
ncbi:MAG TPA: protein kinase [Burkholderiaceae bacterium]|nr:protein kinase [Burkholderiaceae bacterium]